MIETYCEHCNTRCEVKRIKEEIIPGARYGRDPGYSEVVDWAISDCCDETLVDEEGAPLEERQIEKVLAEYYG